MLPCFMKATTFYNLASEELLIYYLSVLKYCKNYMEKRKFIYTEAESELFTGDASKDDYSPGPMIKGGTCDGSQAINKREKTDFEKCLVSMPY